jgi:hypothetical protein
MNPMIKKLVDSEFMTQEHGIYLEDALMCRESIIISGHKGWGILPLMATLGAVAKANYPIKQVKCLEDLAEKADYYIIADAKDVDFGKLVAEAMGIPDTRIIAIKDPDHPYSFFKLLGDVYKATGDTSKVYQVVECAKINDEKKLTKITRVSLDENGKTVKADFQG